MEKYKVGGKLNGADVEKVDIYEVCAFLKETVDVKITSGWRCRSNDSCRRGGIRANEYGCSRRVDGTLKLWLFYYNIQRIKPYVCIAFEHIH
jgi:hypothetical protein